MFTQAICRQPGPDFASGLTTAGLGAPDLELALFQHAAYAEALRSCGLEVRVLPPLPGHPDACFVEDTAVILPEMVVETRPGALSRRGEVVMISENLPFGRKRMRIQAPGNLEGGDVLVVGKKVFVGITERTNEDGIGQLADALQPFGYSVAAVPLAEGLHLKTGVNHLGGNVLLAAPGIADHPALADHGIVLAAPGEGYPCNTLWVNGRLLTPAGFPGTQAALEALGLEIIPLEMSEFQKMDGGVTCLSLRF